MYLRSPVRELNLILLAPPGAGKGTQAESVRAQFGLPYIATGDLLREHRDPGTALGREAARYMADGRLVPDDLVIEMIIGKVEDEGVDGFLLDGFPRSVAQAVAIDRGSRLHCSSMCQTTSRCSEDHPPAAVPERPRLPRQVPPAEATWRLRQDGEPLFQREDDRPQTVEKRLRVYHETTEPLLEYYADRGVLRRFEGTRAKTEIRQQIQATLTTLRLEEHS